MNGELKQLYDADVWEHKQSYPNGTSEYAAMRERDKQRGVRADELIAANALATAEDFYHAARLFQHGDTADDAWKAHKLALQSAQLGDQKARWMAAAAYDRWLMYQGKPQKYGTNYISDGKRQRLWDVDPMTTDEERAAWDVPPLAEQIRKAEEATKHFPPIPINRTEAPQWLSDALMRWESEESK